MTTPNLKSPQANKSISPRILESSKCRFFEFSKCRIPSTTSKKPSCHLIHHHLSSDLSDLSDSSDTPKARWLVDCFFKKWPFFEKTPLKNL